MHTYHVKATLTKDSTLTLVDRPFSAGEMVRVVIVAEQATDAEPNRYPLRGTPVQYVDPTGPIAEDDWKTAVDRPRRALYAG